MSKIAAARIALKVGLEVLGATADAAQLASVFGLDGILGLKQDDSTAEINAKLDQINAKLDDVVNYSKEILGDIDKNHWYDINRDLSAFRSELQNSLEYMLYYHYADQPNKEKYYFNALDKSHDTLVNVINYISSVDVDASVVAPILLSAIAVREEVIWELGDGSFSYDYKNELDRAKAALEKLIPYLDKICFESITIKSDSFVKFDSLGFYTTVWMTSPDFPSEYQAVKYYSSYGKPGITINLDDAISKFNTNHDKTEFINLFKSNLAEPYATNFTNELNNCFTHFDHSVAFPGYDAASANLLTLTSGEHLAGDNGNTDPIDDVLTATSADQIWDDNLNNYVVPAGAQYAIVDGYRGNDILTGNEATNLLRGGEGDDKLYANGGDDIVLGGKGNDLLQGGFGNDRLDGGEGNDTASFEDIGWGANVSLEKLGPQDTYAGTDTLLNIENLIGSPNNDTLIGSNTDNVLSGGDGDDTLKGLAGNDTLDGGYGVNTLEGGLGDDTYFDKYYFRSHYEIDNPIENADSGTDTVLTNIDGYVLGSNIENLTMLGADYVDLTMDISGTGNELDNVITGNTGNNHLSGMAGNDTLVGGDGNDTLDGGAGADKMTGGAGDDTYLVDSASDTTVELAAGGTDTVMAATSYALGDRVEVLTLTGSDNLDGTGNALGNTINGNAGNNKLVGRSGNDTLYGGDGNDKLDGGSGSDQLFGGSGNDTYNVNASGDQVYETASASDTTDLGGTDTVVSSVMFTLGQFVENLTLSGKADIKGTGNDLVNTIIGNRGANTLLGLAGNDTLRGGAGDDLVKGGAGNDSLKGEAGNDMLYGGEGKDTLIGGTGKDFFIFDTTPTSRDTITDFSNSDGDKIQLSKAVFTGFTYTGALHEDDFYAAAGATKAHDSTDRLIYNTTTGILYYDPDGKGGTAAVQIALLAKSAHPDLVYGYFDIIA
ncbi:MAG: calcium-binding protein [Novosphingobium sp.]|uniref:calcium-binding protein n=1 Tax=Novosphingobium sp. TaxID=1874826 RepID=UPI00301A9AE5